MKKASWIVAIVLVLAFTMQVSAAPLFPDVPANHWGRDAVAQLAAKGIIEGYPDGTFKGDRHATRWEMAVALARLLAKCEQMWSTFATKEDLEALKQLVSQLRDELDALGVRVTNLEDNLAKVTKRVWDLEKIRFYGSIDTIAVTQGFQAQAAADPWGLGTGSMYNIHNAVGSAVGASMSPNGMVNMINSGIGAGAGAYTAFPVTDYRNGIPLTNGTSLTTVGILGTKLRVSDDVAAGAEFAAYSRIGDYAVSSYYGVVPPYLSNIFTADMLTARGFNNMTATAVKMTLDNMWMTHKPSGVKLQVGSFIDTDFDPELLYGEVNPNNNGPRVLPFFGFRVTGETHFLSPMKFEVLGSKVSNDIPGGGAVAIAAGTQYNTIMSGFTLDWLFKGGDFKLNFLRTSDDFFGGASLQPGGMENPFGWTNPNDYRAAAVPQQRNRPVAAAALNTIGMIGPQTQTMYGASFRYEFPNNIKFEAVYGSTNYKPNICSDYNVNGTAGRAKLSGSLFHNLLDLAAEYVGVSADYDPYIIPYQSVLGRLPAYNAVSAGLTQVPEPFWRFGQFAYIPGFYQLHNSELMPNNRQGLRLYATYHLPSGNGNIFAKYGSLEQLGATAIMNNGGISDRPGSVESFFPNLTGGLALESPKGRVENVMLGADYKFPNKFYVKASYDHYRLRRPTSLAANVNAANNNVNIAEGVGKIFLSYPTNDKFLLKGGYDFVSFRGAYSNLAVNWDTTQNIPYIGFDYQLSDNTCWSVLAEAYSVDDKVTTTQQYLNMATPFKWNGTRLLTEFKVSF
ncbi:MAG: S-layer homology domain-containing protein [Armatimonadota bacterium]